MESGYILQRCRLLVAVVLDKDTLAALVQIICFGFEFGAGAEVEPLLGGDVLRRSHSFIGMELLSVVTTNGRFDIELVLQTIL